MSKKPKMVFCRNCNAPIAKEARICPQCGAKNKRSHKMRNFILLLLIVAGVAIWRKPDIVNSLKNDKTTATESQAHSTYKDNLNDSSLQTSEATSVVSTVAASSETSAVSSATSETAVPSSSTVSAQSGIRPDFQQAMDSYEAFVNEYCEFMKKYSESNQTDLQMIADYTSYLSKYAEFAKDFEAWNSDDMTNEELAYYLDVQNRVAKKMLEIQ